MIYFFILCLLVFLSYHYDIRGNTHNKKYWYLIIQIILILVAGLRYRIGSDTPNYIDDFYHKYPDLCSFSFEDYPVGKDPFYVLINSIVLSFGGRFYVVQLIHAIIVISLVFHYIKKHSHYWFTCAAFYFVLCYGQFNFEIMRGSISIAICLYANDYILNRKWIKGYLLYVLALMFHSQTIVLLIIAPFLHFFTFNRRGIILLMCSFVGGIIIQHNLGQYIELLTLEDAFSSKAAGYAQSDSFNQSGGNINYFIIFLFPSLFYVLYAVGKKKYYLNDFRLSKFQPLVIVGIAFLLLQVSIIIFIRFVDYYRIYFLLFLSQLFVSIVLNNRKLSIGVSCGKAILFFLPFFFLTGYSIYKDNYKRFFPYNSVINRTINKEREKAIENPKIPSANINEF